MGAGLPARDRRSGRGRRGRSHLGEGAPRRQSRRGEGGSARVRDHSSSRAWSRATSSGVGIRHPLPVILERLQEIDLLEQVSCFLQYLGHALPREFCLLLEALVGAAADPDRGRLDVCHGLSLHLCLHLFGVSIPAKEWGGGLSPPADGYPSPGTLRPGVMAARLALDEEVGVRVPGAQF